MLVHELNIKTAKKIGIGSFIGHFQLSQSSELWTPPVTLYGQNNQKYAHKLVKIFGREMRFFWL